MSDDEVSRPTILFVCTGNVCRSPYMELRLRGMLAASADAVPAIASAGTRALEGAGLAAPLAHRLGELGIDTAGFRARALQPQLLESASLIVTATRDHRQEVVRLQHDAAERTFTLGQLARLLEAASEPPAESTVGAPRSEIPEATVSRLIATALAARGLAPAGGADDDIEDPWRRSRRTYRRVADRIDALLAPLADALSPRAAVG